MSYMSDKAPWGWRERRSGDSPADMRNYLTHAVVDRYDHAHFLCMDAENARREAEWRNDVAARDVMRE